MIELNESNWLAELDGLDPDLEVPPGSGTTVKEFRDFYKRGSTPAGSVYRDNIYYCEPSLDMRLPLYMYAREDPSERRPGVVFIHGGGWSGGHPFMHMGHARNLAADGYVTATIQYRRSGDALWPAALEDAKCAVRWMKAHASEIGLDPDRLAVSGGSAGGHLSTLVALTPGRFEGSGGWSDQSSAVKCAVVWYPMTDMNAPDATEEAKALAKAFLGEITPEKIKESSPVTYVHPDSPPIFTMAGDADVTTPLPMIRDFHAALTGAGVRNELREYPGMVHAYDLFPKYWPESYDRLLEYLEANL